MAGNYIHRTVEKKLDEMYGNFPAILVTGSRQSGKSTVLQYIANTKKQKINEVSLDDLNERVIAVDDPETFLRTHGVPLIIDEFQYIAKSYPPFISIMQKIWDNILSNENIMLILCGSLVNMMYTQTLSYDSPLYGRRTGQIKMKQIAFKHYHEFFDGISERQLIEAYAVTGGVPKYIESFEPYSADIYDAIEKCVMSKESYLYEEPNFLLEKEVQDVGSYFSIINSPISW